MLLLIMAGLQNLSSGLPKKGALLRTTRCTQCLGILALQSSPGMCAHPGKMIQYCRARQTLDQADRGIYLNEVLSTDSAEYCSGKHGHSHPTYFAVQKWLESLLRDSLDFTNSSAIVSRAEIESSTRSIRTEDLEIATTDGPVVYAKMFAKRLRSASGVFPSDIQELPRVCKKGPDIWEIAVQVTAVHG